MSATTSMYLGLAFLGLAIAAVLLQAVLWGPKYWNEETKKTEAPKLWLRVHAICGYSYGGIYLFMMWHMVPRLWEYQYELPARTVIHAVVAITIGVLLICKICILLFFRHFEESMPRYGFGILLSTVILISLSVPFSLRAHDLTGRTVDEANLARVKGLLQEVEMEGAGDLDQLVSKEGLQAGRDVLVSKCTGCHDMRTILIKPRTAKRWYDVSLRMLDKPNPFGEELTQRDIVTVTAYLVAITPDLQQSRKRKRQVDDKVKETLAQLTDIASPGVPVPAPVPVETDTDGADTDGADTDGDDTDGADVGTAAEAPSAEAIPEVDDATGKEMLDAKCTDCHELDEVEAHGGDDFAGWKTVLAEMVEEGAEIDDEDAAKLAAYLARIYPKG